MAQYEVTLRDYWRILRRRKEVVLFTAFLLGFFSFLIASIWRPQPLYQATSKVQINLHQNLTGLYLQTIAYNTGDAIETQQSIITSHPVLKRTADTLDLLAWARTAEDTAVVLTDLTRRIKTSQEGFTNIIALAATDPSPGLARDLANHLARTYRDYDHEQKNQQAVRHREFVEKQRTTARQALEEAEDRVRTYREESELISLESQASVNLQGITASEQQESRLKADLSAVSTMVTEMERNEILSDETLQGASIRRVGETFMALSRQLNSLKLQRNGLLVQFTPDHPNVREIQVQVDQISSDLMGELRQRRQALERDLSTERSRLARLRTQYNLLPAVALELARLQREQAMRQEVARVLEQNYQEALIREADKVEEVKVLEWALTPSVAVNPHSPLQRAVLGVILGFILGVVFAVVAETLDTSIGTIEDVQEYTGTQVVGIVPFINVDDIRASLQRRNIDVSDERTVQRKAQLVAYFDPQSTLAETYRTLRTNIEFVTVEKGVKCFMVTSSMHQEGKSTTIANLSMTMAQLGKRTLLVDCDLRKPSMARLFGLEKEPGVTEVVVGSNKWQDVVRTVTDIVTGGMGMEDILQTQGISNLHIITSGAIPPNPAELLNSRRMSEFLDELRDAYDVILIDTPPTLHVTDAAILGKKLDGALMVYKAGDVARTSLKRSTTLLRSVDIELLGVVLNGIRAEMSSDYQDLGYNAYYAYGSEVSTPERTVEQRVQDWSRRWRKKLGIGGAQEEPRHRQTWFAESEDEEQPATSWTKDEETDDEEERDDEEDIFDDEDVHPVRRLLAYGILLVVLVGGLWQSGAWKFAEGVLRGTVPEVPAQAMTPMVVEDVSTAPVVAEKRSVAPVMPEPVVPEPEITRQLPASAPMAAPAQPPLDAPYVILSDRPYTIRVASYPPESRWATSTLQELRELGEAAFFSPIQVRGERYRRLLVGRWETWEQAYTDARRLRAAGVLKEFTILRLPYAIAGIDASLDRWSDYATGADDVLGGAFETREEANLLVP
jgi:capsular exopolysaccharide synthesis family protein